MADLPTPEELKRAAEILRQEAMGKVERSHDYGAYLVRKKDHDEMMSLADKLDKLAEQDGEIAMTKPEGKPAELLRKRVAHESELATFYDTTKGPADRLAAAGKAIAYLRAGDTRQVLGYEFPADEAGRVFHTAPKPGDRCPHCKGSGESQCPMCDGTGVFDSDNAALSAQPAEPKINAHASTAAFKVGPSQEGLRQGEHGHPTFDKWWNSIQQVPWPDDGVRSMCLLAWHAANALAAPPEQLEQEVWQPTRKDLEYTVLAQARRIHELEVAAAPPAAEQKNTTGDSSCG